MQRWSLLMEHTRGSSLLLLLKLSLVELKLSALEDVAIASSRLAWAGRNASQQSTGVELLSNLLVDDSASSGSLELGEDVSGSLGLGLGLLGLLDLLLVELDIVMLEVPLSERIGINGHNAVLDDSLGSDELVVGGVVDNIQNSGLSGDGLRSPGEASGINSKGAILHVATSSPNGSYSFLTQFSHSWLSTQFELSLLLMNWHAASGGPSLVSRVSVNSHDPDESKATLYNNNEKMF